MSSIKPIRDPKTDHLLTPENSALLIIDYQPIQVHSITSRTEGAGGKYIQYLSCGQRIQCPCYIDYGECCHRP